MPTSTTRQTGQSWRLQQRVSAQDRQCCLRVGDGDLNLYTGLDRHRRDLLDDVRGGQQVDDTLVDVHLEAVPRVCALTARRLARRDLQVLGGHAHRAGHLQVEVQGALLQVAARCTSVNKFKYVQLHAVPGPAGAADTRGGGSGTATDRQNKGPHRPTRAASAHVTRRPHARTLLQVGHVAARQRDADAVQLDLLVNTTLGNFLSRHVRV